MKEHKRSNSQKSYERRDLIRAKNYTNVEKSKYLSLMQKQAMSPEIQANLWYIRDPLNSPITPLGIDATFAIIYSPRTCRCENNIVIEMFYMQSYEIL